MPDATGWTPACRTCGGLGIVCPICRGVQIVRTGGYSPVGTIAGTDTSRTAPCPGCCPRNSNGEHIYDPEREAQVIRAAYREAREEQQLALASESDEGRTG